jgi:hypothetical protein
MSTLLERVTKPPNVRAAALGGPPRGPGRESVYVTPLIMT